MVFNDSRLKYFDEKGYKRVKLLIPQYIGNDIIDIGITCSIQFANGFFPSGGIDIVPIKEA